MVCGFEVHVKIFSFTAHSGISEVARVAGGRADGILSAENELDRECRSHEFKDRERWTEGNRHVQRLKRDKKTER